MKKSFYLLILFGFTLFFFQSCKKNKDEDIDNYIYKTITIGSQVWMAEDLKSITYNDGAKIKQVTDKTEWENAKTGAYCWFENNETSYKNTYGILYNWYAVNTGKLCPKGWHIPSDEEWKQLEKALGMTQAQADKEDWRGTDQGTQMKSTSGWHNNGNGTNTSGFSALPGGYRDSFGSFFYVGTNGFWWTSTENSSNSDIAWYRYLGGGYANVTRSTYFKSGGFCIRCLQD